MDCTFFEDVPFYSSKGKEILEHDKQEEPPTLVQDVSPPTYPNPSNSVSSESERTLVKVPATPLVYSWRKPKFEPPPALGTQPTEIPAPETISQSPN